jgi:glucose-6-phosphate isomerase
MAELNVIAEMLRRQKKDLRDMKANTASRSGETAELVTKIEDLRRRSEETQRRFQAAATESSSEEKK